MAEPKAYEPEKLTAGVTWKWKKTISDYPASEWTLTYYLRKSGVTATSFNAATDGDSYLVTVPAATTAAFASGVYDFIGWVIKGTEKFEVFNSVIEVLPNPTNTSAYDPRSHARRVMELIEAAMEGRMDSGQMESYSIGGRSISKIPLGQLRELWEKYKQDVVMEEQAERLVNGRRSGKNIGIRFNQPSGINVQGYSYIN
jgi:hypothetical protein